jgi:hypothetical protein
MTNNTLSPEGLTWRILGCGNPNKAWIINDLGIKVTKLISVKTARLIVAEHNRALTCAETTREQWQPIETAPHGKWVLICATGTPLMIQGFLPKPLPTGCHYQHHLNATARRRKDRWKTNEDCFGI